MRLGKRKGDLIFTFSQTKFVSIIFSDVTISPNVQVTFLSGILGSDIIAHQLVKPLFTSGFDAQKSVRDELTSNVLTLGSIRFICEQRCLSKKELIDVHHETLSSLVNNLRNPLWRLCTRRSTATGDHSYLHRKQ